MKKTIKLLIFTLLMSFGFLTGLKAETKTCYYQHYYQGDTAKSKYNFKFSITYTYNNSNKQVTNFKISNTSIKIDSQSISIDDKLTKLPYDKENAYKYINSGECPPVYYLDVDGSNGSLKTVRLYNRDSVAVSGKFFMAGILDENGVDNNLMNKINYEDGDKMCRLAVGSLSLEQGKKASDMLNYGAIEFYVVKKPSGKVFFTVKGGSKDEYATKEIIKSFDGNSIYYEDFKKYFTLSSEETDKFLNEYSFDSDNCPSIHLEICGRSKKAFCITTTKTASSVEASEDFSTDADEDKNKFAEDLGWFKDLEISHEVGSCMDYVGPTLAKYLQTIYTIIKVVAILLTIVMSMIDLVNAITKNKDELMPTVKKWATRLIIVIIILLLPTFIDLIGNIAGKEDILCGIK